MNDKKLEQIGFYTLTDARCRNASAISPLWRCEILLTNQCNFSCHYCRGRSEESYTMPYLEAERIVKKFASHDLKNIRLSGGEPTQYVMLRRLVATCKRSGIERIAISTNGSAGIWLYNDLIDLGVNDFSISLDACCAADNKRMNGGNDSWNTVTDNIRKIAKRTYVTVGVVLDDNNMPEVNKIIEFISGLGVADIRIISAAQHNKLENISMVDKTKFPILNYRLSNHNANRNVRGIMHKDSNSCGLVLDDMAIWKDKHYPCIIYLREGGSPIGDTNKPMRAIREERLKWHKNHKSKEDGICSKNCLDVCIDYNNKFMYSRSIK